MKQHIKERKYTNTTKMSVYIINTKPNTNFEVYYYKVDITNVHKISVQFKSPADILPRSVYAPNTERDNENGPNSRNCAPLISREYM